MSSTQAPLDRIADPLADLIIRWRWLAILLVVMMVMAAGSGMRLLEFSNNYRAFFSDENPELMAFEAFQDTYTKNDNIVFVVHAPDEGIFSQRVAAAVELITEKAWQIPYANRVDSVTNFQYSWADGDDLIVEELIENAESLSAAELAKKQAIALAEPLLRNNLIAPNVHTTGINVTLQYPQQSLEEVPTAVAKAREIIDEVQQLYPGLTIVLSGISILNNAFAEAGQADIQTLIPIMYVALIILMLITLRSITATIATLLVIGFSTITAMGITGYLGIKLTPVSVTAPTIILTLAIADSVHVIVSMLTAMREGKDKIAAIKDSIRINFTPITITSLTTAVGFLSLNFSDSPPFWHLGNITAIGIIAAWVYSLVLLPALLSLLPVKTQVHDQHQGVQKILDRLAVFVIRKRNLVLLTAGGLSVLLVVLVPFLELNDEFVKYFDYRIQFRRDAEFSIKHLNGLYLVEYSLQAEEASGVNNPEYLRNLERFTEWLRQQPEIMHVYSYSDIIKRLNKNMHGDDPNWYRIPEDRAQAAQYLLLYELSLPYGLDLNDRINIDKSATRVTATMDNLSTQSIRGFLDRSVEWLETNTPSYMHAQPTSATVMFSYISQRNIEDMLRGNTLAILLIAVIMIFALRSVSLGIFSLIPNSVPILMTFGAWTLLVGQVGMAAATVTATSLGIVVDDTVHFLSKYLRARREKGLDRPQAIQYAFATVGTAIFFTTIILVTGFGILAGSAFLINAQMGLLTAMAILMALVFDFLVLPALLMLGYKETPDNNQDKIVSPAAA